jgi:hypothetical protein
MMPGAGAVLGANVGDRNGGALGMLFNCGGNTGAGTEIGRDGLQSNRPGGFDNCMADNPGLPAYGSAGSGFDVAGEP